MTDRAPSELPASLLRYLPDSDLAVVSWDGANGTLVLRVTKEIGPEIGLLTFRGVSHVNLAPRVGISGIEIGGLEHLPRDFLAAYRPDDQRLESDENAYLIHGTWSEEFFVIAQSVKYEVDPK